MLSFSAKFYEVLQTVGFWVGIVITGIGLVSLLVHYMNYFAPKFYLPFWLRRIFPEPIKRDTKMSEALAYIAAREWGLTFFLVGGNREMFGSAAFALTEMRQAALDGDIRVWGKASINGIFSEISRDYWKIWQIEVHSALSQNGCKTEITETGHYGGTLYYDLMVSKIEVQKKWSPK